MTGILIVIGMIGAAIGLGALGWYFSEEQAIQRAIAALSRIAIRDAKHGELVRIEGKIRPHATPLNAPLSQKVCVHYDVRVEHRVSSGKSSYWKETFRDIASTPFFEIEDESGIARIETRSFKAAVVRDENRSSGMFNDASPELEALLAQHGHTSTSLFGFNKAMRYAEGTFEPGEVIAVIGRVRLEDDPEGAILSDVGFRDQKRQQRVVIEANPDPVRATDEPSVFKT